MNYTLEELNQMYLEYKMERGDSSVTRYEFLSDEVFLINNFDKVLDKIILGCLCRAIRAIHEGKVQEYVDESQENYVSFINSLNYTWIFDRISFDEDEVLDCYFNEDKISFEEVDDLLTFYKGE